MNLSTRELNCCDNKKSSNQQNVTKNVVLRGSIYETF